MYYLIGKDLRHSHSPFIHHAFGRYDYELLSLAEEELPAFLKKGNFDGLNVTVPYKKTVIPYLDELSETAKRIGSVNTIIKKDGKLIGDNTDYLGFFAMAYKKGISFAQKKVVILGSGGTGLAVACVAKDLMAKEVVTVSRSGENNYDNLHLHYDADILVNTTPVGMYPNNDKAPLSLSHFSRLTGVLDVIYNPLRTNLVREAKARNITASGGLYMLVAQAAVSCGLFSGDKPERKEIDAVYRALLKKVSNITLVGMPGSGKSTIASLLAKQMGLRVVDTDELVTELCHRTPADIIREKGEAYFREKEHQAIVMAGKESGVIISTGGGAVLRADNKAPLSQNGPIIMLVRALDALAKDNRPLSNEKDLTALYRERLPRYLSFAEHTYDNNRTPEECVSDIIADDVTDTFLL